MKKVGQNRKGNFFRSPTTISNSVIKRVRYLLPTDIRTHFKMLQSQASNISKEGKNIRNQRNQQILRHEESVAHSKLSKQSIPCCVDPCCQGSHSTNCYNQLILICQNGSQAPCKRYIKFLTSGLIWESSNPISESVSHNRKQYVMRGKSK